MTDHAKIAAVAIPVYKINLTKDEKASFRQVLSVLKNHDIYIFTHGDIDLSSYNALSGEQKVYIKYFAKPFFKSVDGYNRLLCHPIFYEAFSSYKYILIYQLDAWVFQDDLQYWCGLNYDYLGAPWFQQREKASIADRFIGVGNGGFSLRKVKSHVKALKGYYYLNSAKDLARGLLTPKFGRHSIKTTFKNLIFNNSTNHLVRNNERLLNEDLFWNLVIERKFEWFKAPDMMTAIKFSFEFNPAELFEANNGKLPFGCHGWAIYDPPFWAKFINVSKKE